MSPHQARIFRPSNRLASPVAYPGGLARTIAAARAARRGAALRRPVMRAIDILIATLERMAASELPLVGGELPTIRRMTGQLVSLALTYDLDALAEAGMTLCDLLAAFARSGARHREPIAVHVRALKLLAPPQPATGVPSELNRALVRSGATPAMADRQ